MTFNDSFNVGYTQPD